MSATGNSSLLCGVEILHKFNHLDARGGLKRVEFSTKNLPNELSKNVSAISSFNVKKGIVRGLHFQSREFPEYKIVYCASGEIFDVLVDLRKESPSYGQINTLKLDEKDEVSVFIPAGIAHGYQTLSAHSTINYIIFGSYNEQKSFALNFKDSTLDIKWPLQVTEISKRDLDGFNFENAVNLFNK